MLIDVGIAIRALAIGADPQMPRTIEPFKAANHTTLHPSSIPLVRIGVRHNQTGGCLTTGHQQYCLITVSSGSHTIENAARNGGNGLVDLDVYQTQAFGGLDGFVGTGAAEQKEEEKTEFHMSVGTE